MIEILQTLNKFIKMLLSSKLYINVNISNLILFYFIFFMFGIKIRTHMYDII